MAHLRTLLAAFVVALFLAVSLAATGPNGLQPCLPKWMFRYMPRVL